MKKNIFHSLWLPVTITLVSTATVFILAEYVFHIPSRLLSSDSQIMEDDINSWTPRPPMAPIPTNPIPASGSLEEKPTVCTMEYAPVCGADNHDYSNACVAKGAGTTVAYTGNCIKEKEVTSTGIDVPLAPTTTTVSGERDFSLFETGAYQTYENKSFGYKLALPKYAYYQGYGKSNPENTYGADHILAISLSSTGSESLELAEVQLLFAKKPLSNPALSNVIDLPSGSKMYIITQNAVNPKVQKIVDTITASAQ